MRRSSWAVSANGQHHYADTHLFPQLGDFLFQNADPLLVSITLKFNLSSVLSCGTVLKSLLGGFMGLESIYKLPFLPANLILCCGLAWIATERRFYGPLFPLRLSREPGWRWSVFYEWGQK